MKEETNAGYLERNFKGKGGSLQKSVESEKDPVMSNDISDGLRISHRTAVLYSSLLGPSWDSPALGVVRSRWSHSSLAAPLVGRGDCRGRTAPACLRS